MAILSNVFSGIFTTMKGMMVTGRELFRKPVTLQYPYQKREIPQRFRGMLVNDIDTCNGCMRCERICPVDCIDVEAVGKGKERKASKFVIDYTKCCWCNLCVEACPHGSLSMTHDYETIFTDRSQMVRDFAQQPYKPLKSDLENKETAEKEETANSGRSAA